MRVVTVLAILALVVGGQIGCVNSSTVTEGDRLVMDQTKKAIGIMQDAIEEALARAEKGSESWNILSIGAAAGQVAALNTQHQESTHGPPKEPMPFSEANSAKAREQSKKEHESGGLGGTLLTIGGVLVGVATTLAGMPMLSRVFPALAGVIGKAAQTGPKVIAYAREAFEARGWNDQAKVLLKIADEENILSGAKPWVVKQAAALERKLGLDFKVKLEEPTPSAPAPAPQPAASVPTAS